MNDASKWTHFWDMHSGGGTKEAPYEHIYIEAPEDEAVKVFYNRFGHNPFRVSCTCCGNDYSVSEYDTLEEATSYQRNDYESEWKTGQRISPEDYFADPLKYKALIVYGKDIAPQEREGDVPEQGYVWKD